MNQTRPEQASTRQGTSSLRATRQTFGSGLGVALVTQFAIEPSALAVARFATRPHRAPFRTATAAGSRAPRGDRDTGPAAGSGEESHDRSAPGNVAGEPFDAFLETCAPPGHPPHE